MSEKEKEREREERERGGEWGLRWHRPRVYIQVSPPSRGTVTVSGLMGQTLFSSSPPTERGCSE